MLFSTTYVSVHVQGLYRVDLPKPDVVVGENYEDVRSLPILRGPQDWQGTVCAQTGNLRRERTACVQHSAILTWANPVIQDVGLYFRLYFCNYFPFSLSCYTKQFIQNSVFFLQHNIG